MKIVYICSARLPSEKAHGLQIVRMCDALAGLGHDVVLLHPAKRQAVEHFREADVREYYDCKNRFDVESMSIFQLPDVLWRLPPVIHRPLMNSMNLLFEKRLARRALVIEADLYYSRDMTPHAARKIVESGERCILEFHQAPSGTLATKSLRVLAANTDDVYSFAVTRLLANDLEQVFNVPSGAIGVHHDGADLTMYEKASPRRQRSNPVVTYAGSFQPSKGVDFLIESAALCPGVDFRIVGGASGEVGKMRSFAAELDVTNVEFVGQIRPGQVPAELQESNLLVMPMRGNEVHSARHTSALKLFEYMASGTPIVATDLASVREVVEHRYTAYMVKPDDPASLADGIKSVLADSSLASRMSTNALREVAKYSWTTRAQKIVERAEEMLR